MFFFCFFCFFTFAVLFRFPSQFRCMRRAMAALLSSAWTHGVCVDIRSGGIAPPRPFPTPPPTNHRRPPAHASLAVAALSAAAGPGPSSARLAGERRRSGGAGQATLPRGGRSRERAAAAAVSAVNAAAAAEGGGGGGGGADPASSSSIITLPRPTHTRVKTAEYISSAVDLKGCPPASVPEFALIGRSNVGKSSLINALTGRNALAQVSKQPGKTRTINHFLVNGAGPAPWYLVDLPGYGYARAGATFRMAWASFSQAFFLERPTLATVLLLADGTLPPQPADLECAAWLAEAGVPFCVVLTKADKRVKVRASLSPELAAELNADGTRSVSGTAANAAALAAALSEALGGPPPPMLATSAATGAGRNEVLTYIAQVRALAESGGGEGVNKLVGKKAAGGAPEGVPDDEWW